MTSLFWVLPAFPLLLLMQQWIHTHLRGVALLVTGRPEWSLWLYALVLMPGVFLHEFSHWLTAGLLGVRTGRFSLIPRESADGVQLGFVEYYRDNRLGALRESMIGAAPLIFGSTAIILISRHIFDLPTILALLTGGEVAGWLEAARLIFLANDAFLWLYLLFAISNAMFPSASDRRSWPTVGLFLVGVFGAAWLTDLMPVVWANLHNFVEVVLGHLALVLGITITLNLGVIALIAVLEALLSRLRGRTVRYGGG
jgi:hypothetical protein